MTTRIRIASALLMLAAVAAIYAGTRTPTVDATGLYGQVATVPGYTPGPDAVCLYTEGRAEGPVMGHFIPGWDAGSTYALVATYVSPAGPDASYPELEHGMDPLPPAGEYRVEACDAGTPQVRVWALGHPQAPWACACAASAACEWSNTADGGWAPAPRGLTLYPGGFRGTCVRKPCGSFAEADDAGHPVDRTMPGGCL